MSLHLVQMMIMEHFCPKSSLEAVERAVELVSSASSADAYQTPIRAQRGFVCKNCGHDDYKNCTTHFVCTKCAVVQQIVHQGEANRNMKDDQGILQIRNTTGMRHNRYLSETFNKSTIQKMPDNKPAKFSDKVSRRDEQIIKAKHAFEEMCDKLHFANAHAIKAIHTFCKFRSTLGKKDKMPNKHIIYAACAFMTLERAHSQSGTVKMPRPKAFKRKKKVWNKQKRNRIIKRYL